MRRLLIIIAMLSAMQCFAQRTDIYRPLPCAQIQATSSSTLEKFTPALAVDGSGMSGIFHQSHNLGHTMWISNPSAGRVRANPNTREGVVWFMCQFETVERGVDFIQIWNHNQNQHTRRGLQKVYIEYSADGRKWTLLKNGSSGHFIIPEAVGRASEPASLSIETGGVDMKYLCITADPKNGNYYHDGDPVTLMQAREMQQNPDYYGLSEVRFFRRENVDVSQLTRVKHIEFTATQGYRKTEAGPSREFTLTFDTPLYCAGRVTVEVGNKIRDIEIAASAEGIYNITETLPAGYMEEDMAVKVTFASPQGTVSMEQNIPAARKWTLYFLPHSHLDIGYTHRQKDVMTLQWRNLERAVALAERTADYPEGSQFKWNAEATWPVSAYLDKHKDTDRSRRLIGAIQREEIGMDATLGSILTGISKQEELMHMFDDAHRIAALTGTEINTAMMSDVPGQSWGVVNAMAQNGVRYFSSGPNYVPSLGRLGSYGVGLYNLKWGDLPFWWQSQSGTERILYWQTGKGYSMFHGWLMDKLSVCGTTPIWNYLAELEQREYPYDLTYLRYTIHGDNGPPDEQMPDVIRQWNEQYDSPRFVIGTTKELFTEMEHRYGEHLPTYSGDMTPIWEDGAASSARELAMNRESSERLNRAEILWSMLRPESEFPAPDFLDAWKYVVLFSEHTWGAAGSGPEPQSQFTKDLWAGKKFYADSADIASRHLYSKALAQLQATSGEYVHVLNTNLWVRSDVVELQTAADLDGKMLESPLGEKIPLQRLHNGNWIFYAENLPALSSTVYRIVAASPTTANTMSLIAEGNIMDNGRIRVVIDKTRGTISSFTNHEDTYEYASDQGLNDYIYSGKGGSDQQKIEKIRAITILNDGDVAATLRIESDAPGCRSLWRDVTVYRDIDRVDIVNTIDKQNIYESENVRFIFPFNFFNPDVVMDLAMGEAHPERDQLESANKNFYSLLNGLSVCDIKRGVHLTSIDAPFVELGSMTADLTRVKEHATGWLNAATVSPTVYSWVMNNRWRTNYKASQEGPATFRYSLQTFDPEQRDLKKQGSEQAQKPVAVLSARSTPIESLFRVRGRNRIAISTIRPSADGQGYIVRLQNMAPLTAHSSIEWQGMKADRTYLCSNSEQILSNFDHTSFWLKPYECITIKVTKQ